MSQADRKEAGHGQANLLQQIAEIVAKKAFNPSAEEGSKKGSKNYSVDEIERHMKNEKYNMKVPCFVQAHVDRMACYLRSGGTFIHLPFGKGHMCRDCN